MPTRTAAADVTALPTRTAADDVTALATRPAHGDDGSRPAVSAGGVREASGIASRLPAATVPARLVVAALALSVIALAACAEAEAPPHALVTGEPAGARGETRPNRAAESSPDNLSPAPTTPAGGLDSANTMSPGAPGQPAQGPSSPEASQARDAAGAVAGEATAKFQDRMAAARESLVRDHIEPQGINDARVIEAMRTVPRHLFVPDRYTDQAYEDHPLPIGHGQTISQPYIVALMTDALRLSSGDRVLEIGTGSGYQAAVLAEIVDHVYTVEIVGALVEQARSNLRAAGYPNVTVRHADGYFGLPEHGPYDAIIVTAAPDHVPPPLQAQLADGGSLVIPVGPVGGYQELWLVERAGDEFATTSLGGVAFVPLTRDPR